MAKKWIILLLTAMAAAGPAEAQQVPLWKPADLKAAMDTASRPTIFNFWATFCRPCIAEMPHFQALANEYKEFGLNLIFVSLDLKEAYPKSVTAFVRSRKLTAPVVFLDEPNADLFLPLVDSTWTGAIPASLFINKANGYRKFFEEELSRQKLQHAILAMLGKKTEEGRENR